MMMTYNDFLNDDNGVIWTNNLVNYPNFKNHIKQRFGDYELLYTSDKTLDFLNNILGNYIVNIKQAEMLTNVNFESTDLGNLTTSESKNKTKADNVSKLSYEGYNANGNYNSTESTVNDKQTHKGSQTSLNKLRETIDINNAYIRKIYDNIDYEIFSLFRLIY